MEKAKRKVALVFVCCTHIMLSVPAAYSRSATNNQNHEQPTSYKKTIRTNRYYNVLGSRSRNRDLRYLLRKAGTMLGDNKVNIANVVVDGHMLVRLAEHSPDEPLLRLVREELKRPIDLKDFLLFLDDLLRAQKYWNIPDLIANLPPHRARAAGILVHPCDVFRRGHPRRYGRGKLTFYLESELTAGKTVQEQVQPSQPVPRWLQRTLGPGWADRYLDPVDELSMMQALQDKNPFFEKRVEFLTRQLRAQGALVTLITTVRDRRRGYLMWGAYALSRARTEQEARQVAHELTRLDRAWRMRTRIRWWDPRGWRRTRLAATAMANAFEVVFATRQGARTSRHYKGKAVDFTAYGLPRKLTLHAPDGARQTFDLSAPEQTRDLNLTGEVIAWIADHFRMKKLLTDYPHWNDVAAPKDELRMVAFDFPLNENNWINDGSLLATNNVTSTPKVHKMLYPGVEDILSINALEFEETGITETDRTRFFYALPSSPPR